MKLGKANQSAQLQASIYKILRRYVGKPCPTNKTVGNILQRSEGTIAYQIRQMAEGGLFLIVNMPGSRRKLIFGDGEQTEVSRQRKPKPPPKPQEPPWTPEEKARAFELRDRNLSAKSIGYALSRSRNAVLSMFHREREAKRAENQIRTGEVTLARYALGEQARAEINRIWKEKAG